MILAIVGTRTFTNPNAPLYAEILITHEVTSTRWTSFVTGDATGTNARGIDAMVKRICDDYDKECRVLAPENRRWAPSGFQARNIRIAETADEMLCIRDPGTTNSKGLESYGSGWTANYMETLGKPVTRVLIT